MTMGSAPSWSGKSWGRYAGLRQPRVNVKPVTPWGAGLPFKRRNQRQIRRDRRRRGHK